MADLDGLKQRIAAVIKTNGEGEITGAKLQETLLDMVDELGQGAYTVATSSEMTTIWNNIN